MQLAPIIYLVVINHRDGAYIPETDIDRTSLTQVCLDLREGQYKDALAVLECHVRDATHDFKDLLP